MTRARARRAACLAVVGLVAASCRTARPEAPRGAAAVIVRPTDASRAELAAAVRAALHGAEVTLAHDALTTSSTLAVERRRVQGPAGPPAVGRDLDAPERFLLLKRGGACFLVHEGSGQERLLESTTCAASGE